MKSILTIAVSGIVATIFLINAIEAIIWDTLLIRTNIYDTHKKKDHIKLPKSKYDPAMKHFVKVTSGHNVTYLVNIYCHYNDPRVCIILDNTDNNPAGVALSFIEEDFRNVSRRVYDISAAVGFEKTSFFGIPAYTVFVYFTNPCILDESGRIDTNEVAEVLWIKISGKWVKLERCQPNGPRMGDFYLQGCYPKLGTIYVYKFNQYSRCKDAFLFYVSYDRESLVQFGILNVGRGGSSGPRKDWYAHPAGKPLADLIPAAPPCFKHFLRYGFTSLQVYLTSSLDSIKCLHCKA